MTLLTVRSLSKAFGGVRAVDRVTFQVPRGSAVALIGPNGAGKTTVFNVVSGVLRPDQGEVTLGGRPVQGLAPHRLAALGLTRTFQNLQIFPTMTVRENVMVGCFLRTRTGFLSAMLDLPQKARDEREGRRVAERALGWVGLLDRSDDPAGELPYGQQRLVEIARALAMEPEILLLDEPCAGLTREEAFALASLILRLREHGMTFLFIEHDMNVVAAVADWVVVLDFGVKIAEGTPDEVQQDPRVIAAYLGEDIRP